jgi:hypothetical protein
MIRSRYRSSPRVNSWSTIRPEWGVFKDETLNE